MTGSRSSGCPRSRHPESDGRLRLRSAGRVLDLAFAAVASTAEVAPGLFTAHAAGLWGSAERRDERLWYLRGRAGRRVCERMGATYVKLAQILSTRRDLLPPAALRELERLHDDVPAAPMSYVAEAFERDFSVRVGDVFEHLDEAPLACGSVAQVHRGVLRNGREVAVKALRPGIAGTMERDSELLVLLARACYPLHRSRTLVEGSREFGALLHKQLDLRIEADNIERCQRVFRDIDHMVKFPSLIREYCSQNILTMDLVHGTKPTVIGPNDQHRKRLARNIILFYYEMLLHGLLHADLHPGNLLVGEDGCYWVFDLGLVAELDWEKRRAYFEAWMAIFTRKGEPVARFLLRCAKVHAVCDARAFEAEVTGLLETHIHERIGEIEIGGFLLALNDVQRRHGIVADPAWTGVCLSLVAAEGLARHLDPDLSVSRTIAPELSRMLRRLYVMDPRQQQAGAQL